MIYAPLLLSGNPFSSMVWDSVQKGVHHCLGDSGAQQEVVAGLHRLGDSRAQQGVVACHAWTLRVCENCNSTKREPRHLAPPPITPPAIAPALGPLWPMLGVSVAGVLGVSVAGVLGVSVAGEHFRSQNRGTQPGIEGPVLEAFIL